MVSDMFGLSLSALRSPLSAQMRTLIRTVIATCLILYSVVGGISYSMYDDVIVFGLVGGWVDGWMGGWMGWLVDVIRL